jgi:uncharacterized protein (DUF362 family)/NAD-dependent dihydropyrimidine dehydrogenase PreA subunit
MSTKVSIVNVNDYDSIPNAVVSAIQLIENSLSFDISNSEQILLKPNLLRASKNACSQSSVVEGVILYLKEQGISMDNVLIGDSPGQQGKSVSDIAEEIGMFEVCEEHGIKLIDFGSGVPVVEMIKDAISLKEFRVAKTIKDCDVLINLPKLKSHAEATMTGAIKNYWGIIPGGLKAKYHLLGKSADEFGEVLADNFSWIVKNKPHRLTVYDLQEIMEGAMGPAAGKMTQWDLILVGTDELALDVIALEIGKFKPKNVPHVKNAIERNLGVGNLENIEVVGMTLDEAKKLTPKFNAPGRTMTRFISYITGHMAYKIMKRIPDLMKTKCVQCGQCAQNCPADAIEFEKGNYPSFLRKKCISCLCCMELCPEDAIEAKSRGLLGLFD